MREARQGDPLARQALRSDFYVSRAVLNEVESFLRRGCGFDLLPPHPGRLDVMQGAPLGVMLVAICELKLKSKTGFLNCPDPFGIRIRPAHFPDQRHRANPFHALSNHQYLRGISLISVARRYSRAFFVVKNPFTSIKPLISKRSHSAFTKEPYANRT